jgi:hypothetical protein
VGSVMLVLLPDGPVCAAPPPPGAVPHSVPDSAKVTPDQPNRFAGDKDIGTGFGTGSAAGWASDSVKRATGHFTNTSSSRSSAGGCAVRSSNAPA